MQNEAVFSALSNPVRRRLLELLAEGPATPGALAARFSLSRPAVSEHLAVLRSAGLVSEELRGRERIYSLEVAPLGLVADWLKPFERYWRARFSGLRDLLEEPDT